MLRGTPGSWSSRTSSTWRERARSSSTSSRCRLSRVPSPPPAPPQLQYSDPDSRDLESRPAVCCAAACGAYSLRFDAVADVGVDASALQARIEREARSIGAFRYTPHRSLRACVDACVYPRLCAWIRACVRACLEQRIRVSASARTRTVVLLGTSANECSRSAPFRSCTHGSSPTIQRAPTSAAVAGRGGHASHATY